MGSLGRGLDWSCFIQSLRASRQARIGRCWGHVGSEGRPKMANLGAKIGPEWFQNRSGRVPKEDLLASRGGARGPNPPLSSNGRGPGGGPNRAKSIDNRCQDAIKFCFILFSSLRAFRQIHLIFENPQEASHRPQVNPGSTPDQPWIDPRSTPDRLRPDPKSTPNHPQIDPKSTPDRPRIDPKSTPDRPQTDPGSTADRPQNRPQIDPRSDVIQE